jgi:hypothetical protein
MVTIVALILPVYAAEKKKFTLQTKLIANKSGSTIYLEDKPKHLLTQTVQLRKLTSSNPDFNGLDIMNYSQADSIAGNGSHRGYSFYYHKNGDKSFLKWEGIHKASQKEDESWETNAEGYIEFVGGTGMYNNIKGGGNYTCLFTASGGGCEAKVEAEY